MKKTLAVIALFGLIYSVAITPPFALAHGDVEHTEESPSFIDHIVSFFSGLWTMFDSDDTSHEANEGLNDSH
jgi:hypothetical protein